MPIIGSLNKKVYITTVAFSGLEWTAECLQNITLIYLCLQASIKTNAEKYFRYREEL